MNFSRCTRKRKDPLIVVEEKGRRLVIENSTRRLIKVVTVDGCLINDKRIRCDYLFEVNTADESVIYVELKGSDIDYAFNQLVATLGYCDTRHKTWSKECYIVASRVPRAGPKVQVLQVQMKQKHGATLRIYTQEAKIRL
jgi:hypothetical protein